MAELRTDWLTGRSVIVAENRALRPNEFTADPPATSPNIPGEAALAAGSNCPFCVGNESRTPPSIYERLDEHGKWQLRVVPNMFPAVMLADDAQVLSSADATGRHEVIVEISRHADRTSALSIDELNGALEAYRARLSHWRDDGRFAYGLVFKNQGPRAGASIAHLHSQFIALAAVPPAAAAELRRAEQQYQEHRDCPYCRLIEEERAFRQRIVFDRDGFIAFCPNASLQPHEVCLLPAVHESSFEQQTDNAARLRLANVMHELIARLESIVPSASYNMLLRTAPWKTDCAAWFHWRIELIPRVNAIAGLEIATGMHINPLPPERAASQLRPN